MKCLEAMFFSRSLQSETHEEYNEGVEIEPVYNVLFPWFTQLVGMVGFFLLTRYANIFPYTGLMFIIGVIMGAGANHRGNDQLTLSIRSWSEINGEVIFLIFLPALIFKDSFEIKFHLFCQAFWQIILLAFPMVLMGAVLTALVGWGVFPYGWSWMQAMTFGSILAATDPVAVAALLNEVGAPPRLKMHISGESIFNDGSAIVFYTIFSGFFYSELGFDDLGSVINLGEGIGMFLKLSLGAAAIGLLAGLVLICLLYAFNSRLNSEENVVQVCATITMSYLTYYVADPICGVSGVIAVACMAISSRAFGGAMINDWSLMSNTWSIIEHLFNSLLFTLGGVVWGDLISPSPLEVSGGLKFWAAREWGYLFLLYLFLTIIRLFCLFTFFPITSRIGLKTSWQETVFSAWGGLRGAVGITLGLSVNNNIWERTSDPEVLVLSSRMFGMIGGIAFLTLIINGITCGPILKKLGLAKSPEAREKILISIKKILRKAVVEGLANVLSHRRAGLMDFTIVKSQIPELKDLKAEELKEAVLAQKEAASKASYENPNLSMVISHLKGNKVELTKCMDAIEEEELDMIEQTIKFKHMESMNGNSQNNSMLSDDKKAENQVVEMNCCHGMVNIAFSKPIDTSPKPTNEHKDDENVKEMRLMFIEFLRASYNYQQNQGDINGRALGGFLTYSLEQSLDIAADAANKGFKLNDWYALQSIALNDSISSFTTFFKYLIKFKFTKIAYNKQQVEVEKYRLEVLRALAFIDAHRVGQIAMKEKFTSTDSEKAALVVIQESEEQIAEVVKHISTFDINAVRKIISNQFALMIVNKKVRKIKEFCDSGVLTEKEAGEFMEEAQAVIYAINHASSKIDENMAEDLNDVQMEENKEEKDETKSTIDVPLDVEKQENKPRKRRERMESIEQFVESEMFAFQDAKTRVRDIQSSVI